MSTLPRELKGGRYTLLSTLGEGAQGETYEGRDNGAAAERPSPDRLVEDFRRYVERAAAGASPNPRGLVAIKCFRVRQAKAWKDVELAEREARTLAKLRHPNLPVYLDHFEEDGALYLVMEKIDGESLAALRARGATMSAAEVQRMLEDIGGALRYLHGLSPPIIHRDVKPANVIRRPDGSFALVDFGAVRDRLEPAGGSTVVGTFGYMAPEQFQGRARPESDLYGLGATALTLLTGLEPEDLPHEGLGIDVARALPRSAPARLRRGLASMLVPDPDRRAASIEEALAPPEASPPPAPEASRPGSRRKERRERRRSRRQSRRARRAERHRGGVPFVARVFAQLGLFVALGVVWLTAGVLVPILLVLLSVLFGPALRRAARACLSAATHSQRAIGRASARVWGLGAAATLEPPPQVRVAAGAAPARVSVDDAEDAEIEADFDEESDDAEQDERRGRRRV